MSLQRRRRPACCFLLLALPFSACAASPTSPDIPFRQIGSGSFSEFTEQQLVVVRDGTAWTTVRDRLSFGLREPHELDFATEMALVVALGARPTAGYVVRVERVRERRGALEIAAVEEIPGQGCVTLPVVTQPFEVIAVPRSDRPSRTDWSKTTRNCQ